MKKNTIKTILLYPLIIISIIILLYKDIKAQDINCESFVWQELVLGGKKLEKAAIMLPVTIRDKT